MPDLRVLQQKLDLFFNDLSLLEQALIHSSYINENPSFALNSNERLEFLGDAILNLIIAHKLYKDLAHLAEGELTKLRAVLVRGEALARIAKTIRLGDHLYLGKGEETNRGRYKLANLAGAFEALIAAIFLDQGFSITEGFVLKLFYEELQKVLKQGAEFDYKSKLQELIQAKDKRGPTYHMVRATGPDHEKLFTIEVRAHGIVLGRGVGKSKKMAETEAARSALERF